MARTKIDPSLLNPLSSPLQAAAGTTSSAPAYTFSGDTNTGMYQPSADILSLCVGGGEKVEVTAANGVIMQGTTTNDSAAAGNVGEYISSLQGTPQNASGSGQLTDITSIALTAGDWDVSANYQLQPNGATFTNTNWGIGTVVGNNATNMADFDARFYSTTALQGNFAFSPRRYSLSGNQTLYLKFSATYTVGTPQGAGRIQARRVR